MRLFLLLGGLEHSFILSAVILPFPIPPKLGLQLISPIVSLL